MGRITATIEIARSSWRVLKADKELMVLPVLSGLASAVIVAGFLLFSGSTVWSLLTGGRGGRMPVNRGPDERVVTLALEVARGAESEARTGSAVTVDEVVWTSAAKADLHAWMEHDVVEMESYWIGQAAAAADLPYLALRVVTDEAADELVDTTGVSADGTFDVEAFQAWITDHPEHIPLFAGQAERSRRGHATLARFLSAFLPRLVASQVS
ncbi:MAG: hypothetical protein IH863_08595 [Chloroflexi bacterium]|nr:hypothetical protein [Chloroflexota bacterium]